MAMRRSQHGHVVGNHTWTHPDLTQLTVFQVRDQLQRTSEEMRAITGVSPSIFRPPGGNFNETVQSVAASLGLSTIVWNVDPRDWSQPGVDVIIQRVLATVHNGSIILLHDGGGDRSETVAALPTIITTLEQRGFQFVTIPRLIQDL
jgi:peptidoglycan-N-acetylglucosamine deacetylase